MKIIPSTPEILREAIIVLAGAALAVFVVRSLPKSWQDFFTLK